MNEYTKQVTQADIDDALDFILDIDGWFSYAKDALTVEVIRQLVMQESTVEINEHHQFRITRERRSL